MHSRQSVLVDNDHRLSFVSRNEIVQDEIFVSLVAPACFVFAPPVLKVQDRIALAVLVVPRRRCQAKKAILRPPALSAARCRPTEVNTRWYMQSAEHYDEER